MDAVNKMNGTIWIFAALLIALVLVQSFLFLRHALCFNKKHQLITKDEEKFAVRVGAIAAIGPSINSIVVALSLIAMVGPATAFMRCGVIGAPPWELYMANIAASAAGVTFGSPEFTENVFTMCIFCMVLGSAPYFLNTIIMFKPLDNMVERSKAQKKKISFMPYLSGSSMFALLTYSLPGYLATLPGVIAIIFSAAAYILWSSFSKRVKSQMLASFGLGVAMIIGMTAGQLCTLLLA